METQSPGAGPSRHASVHSVEESAPISMDSDGQLLSSLLARIKSLEEQAVLQGNTTAHLGQQAQYLLGATQYLGQQGQHLSAATQYLGQQVQALSMKPRASIAFGPKDGVWCDCRPQLDLENGRNLVVCIDGTANQFGAKVRELWLDRYSVSLTNRGLHRTQMLSSCTAAWSRTNAS